MHVKDDDGDVNVYCNLLRDQMGSKTGALHTAIRSDLHHDLDDQVDGLGDMCL